MNYECLNGQKNIFSMQNVIRFFESEFDLIFLGGGALIQERLRHKENAFQS